MPYSEPISYKKNCLVYLTSKVKWMACIMSGNPRHKCYSKSCERECIGLASGEVWRLACLQHKLVRGRTGSHQEHAHSLR